MKKLIAYFIVTLLVFFIFDVPAAERLGNIYATAALSSALIYLTRRVIATGTAILSGIGGAIVAEWAGAEWKEGAGCGVFVSLFLVAIPLEIFLWMNAGGWGQLQGVIPQLTFGEAALITAFTLSLSTLKGME